MNTIGEWYVMEEPPVNADPADLRRYLQDEFLKLQHCLNLLHVDGEWQDNTAALSSGKSPAAAPTMAAFGPDGATEQLQFAVGDIVYLNFHILHDIKRNSKIYPHVHWASSGTTTGDVTWEITYVTAKGHNQEAFGSGTSFQITQANSATAWQHQISEASDAQAFDAIEVDGVVLVKVELIANGSGGNVFGLFADLHYQMERLGTKNKAPDFYK